jgi:hypothetical protein
MKAVRSTTITLEGIIHQWDAELVLKDRVVTVFIENVDYSLTRWRVSSSLIPTEIEYNAPVDHALEQGIRELWDEITWFLHNTSDIVMSGLTWDKELVDARK